MKYTTEQINKALDLVRKGYTHKQAAKQTKMKVYSINYYLTRNTANNQNKIYSYKSRNNGNNQNTIYSYKSIIRDTILKLEALL
jgi:orotate phosphoribosyltransferase-like protein